MKHFIFTMILACLAFLGQAQTQYDLIKPSDSTFLLRITQPLQNDQTNQSFEPATAAIDSLSMIEYLFTRTLEVKRQQSYYEVQANEARLEGQRLASLALTQMDSLYYDWTWARLGNQFIGQWRMRVGTTPIFNIESVLNPLGRVVFTTDAGNSAVRIESNKSITIINMSEIGETVTLNRTQIDSRRIFWEGAKMDGTRIIAVQIR